MLLGERPYCLRHHFFPTQLLSRLTLTQKHRWLGLINCTVAEQTDFPFTATGQTFRAYGYLQNQLDLKSLFDERFLEKRLLSIFRL